MDLKEEDNVFSSGDSNSNSNSNTKSFICMTIKELQYCKSYSSNRDKSRETQTNKQRQTDKSRKVTEPFALQPTLMTFF